MRVVGVVVALTLGSGMAALAQQTRDRLASVAPRTGSAVISGTIVADDASKRPIRRATVLVAEETGVNNGRMTVTNDRGEFVVPDLPAGRYLVTATKGAYLAAAYGATRPRPGSVRTGTPIVLAEGQRVSDLVVPMMRGGVITGVIRDGAGRPARGVAWMVAHYTRSPQNGERVMTRVEGAAGVSTTDSRGVYRIYGLPPGEYVVAALPVGAPNTDLLVTTAAEKARVTAVYPPGPQPPPPPTRPRVGFARVYYPGTTMPAEAAPIKVGAGEERTGIDFSLQLVTNARVEGTLLGLNGAPVSGSTVMLHSDAKPAGLDAGNTSARTDALGQFSLRGLPPGSYTLSAATSLEVWGATPVVVQGDDVRANIQLRGSTIVAGMVVVEPGATTAAPDLSRVRVRFVAESSAAPVSSAGGVFPVSPDGRFRASLIPGRYRLLVTLPGSTGAGNWIVKSAVVARQDVVDMPFDVREGTNVSDAVLTLTSRASELSGRMTGAEGRPATDYFVIVFPVDSALWGWQARRIQQTRPSHDGTFAFRNLPHGEYLIAAVTDVEQNEWFDMEFLKSLTDASIRVTLADGEKKTQMIQVK